MPCQRDSLVQRPGMCRVVYAGALVLILLSLAVPRVAVAAGVPNGVWLIHAKVAVQIFAGGSWLYNPDDGMTYRVRAELRSADTFVARIYFGIPLFGETWTLLRVPRLSSEGWC